MDVYYGNSDKILTYVYNVNIYDLKQNMELNEKKMICINLLTN